MFFVFVFTVNVTVAEDLHCMAMVSAKKSSLLFYWMSCILNGRRTSKLQFFSIAKTLNPPIV